MKIVRNILELADESGVGACVQARLDLDSALDHHIEMLEGERIYPVLEDTEIWLADGDLDVLDGLEAERLARVLRKRGEL